MQVVKEFPRQTLNNKSEAEIAPKVIYNAEGKPVRLENVRSARGFLCSGDIRQSSNEYSNIFLLIDDVDQFVHVVHKRQLGIELGSPTTKRSQNGQIRQAGGFDQPMEPSPQKDPIFQKRHTNPLI